MAVVEDFREWQSDVWFDKGFLQRVPAHALKEFMRAIHPLSAELHGRVHKSLFAGIKEPFHYLRVNGWMRSLLRAEWTLPAMASVDQRVEYMREKTVWSPSDVVFLVYHQPTTYATTWASFLRYFRKDYFYLDTMLVCHPRSRDVVLFWEDDGPRFGKRGHRELPQPRWDYGEDADESTEPEGISQRGPLQDQGSV
ncbi:MAG TPA: hypothetical protein VFE62_07330 [Gemmataceae bacterium]|nr:hypothetical protein [Gemmataceae bacterium]